MQTLRTLRRRAVCAPEDALVRVPGDTPLCAPGDAPVVRARRAGCAPEDALCVRPVRARKTCRMRAVYARGPVRSFCVEAGVASK